MRFLWKSLQFGYLLLVLFTLFTYLTPFVPPAGWWGFFAVLGLGFPYLFVLHVVALLVLLWRTSRYGWYALGVLALGLPFLLRTVNFNATVAAPGQISITTFNIQILRLHPSDSEESGLERLRRTIGQTDIFCAQELPAVGLPRFHNAFGYPHRFTQPGVRSAIFSRYPIGERGVLDLDSEANDILWADLRIGDRTLRVYNVHLESNRVSEEVAQLREAGDLRSRETWRTAGEVLRGFSQRAKLRTAQLKTLRAHIERSPHPVVVMGDFNDTPQSYTYRQLSQLLQDGFTKRGSGLGHTYAGPIPWLRIDYIFASPEIEFQSYRTHRRVHTDHYPVTARITL